MEELASSNASLMKMFEKKVQGFIDEVENNQIVWLQEIQEEAVKMFCSNFSEEPQLMPNPPSQKKKGRKKRSSFRRVENQNPNRRRLSRTRRSTVSRSSVKVLSLNLINEELQKESLKVEDLEHSKPLKATLNENKASSVTKSCAKTLSEKKVVVEITLNDRLAAEIHQKNIDVHETIGNLEEMCPEDVSSDTERSTFESHRPSGQRSIAGHRSLLRIRKSLTRESMCRASQCSVHKKAMLKSSTSSSRNSNGKAEHSADHLKRHTFCLPSISCKQAVAELNSQGEDCQADQPVIPVKKPLPVVSVPKSHRAMKPHLKSFLRTVQKNQLGQSAIVKYFIKCATRLKVDITEKERQFLEMLKKKVDQKIERKKKMEEEKKLKLEEVKRKRKEHLKKVTEAREREEQKEKAKKRKIVQKFAQMKEKNDKEEEERKDLELLQKKREEEEQERVKKMAEVKRLKQIKQERQLAAEKKLQRKRVQERIRIKRKQRLLEKKKAIAVQMEVEKVAKKKALWEAAKEKERLQKEAEKSPQSYQVSIAHFDSENFVMDLNSDDSTDDESAPRKHIPSWAQGQKLNQAVVDHYYNPPDTDKRYGKIEPPNLEEIFCKSKPRYLKRTSSAVWHSPPKRTNLNSVSMMVTC
ncbi:inner centromere protein A-like [Polypterus senegalus]|uniref:inner centromere protein A-like n=1 Tax=Polypterus senegalus TaxID=55291 RepID=UPI00196486B6|nr:inner centromere protein A-like [Polypterus senegalus]